MPAPLMTSIAGTVAGGALSAYTVKTTPGTAYTLALHGITGDADLSASLDGGEAAACLVGHNGLPGSAPEDCTIAATGTLLYAWVQGVAPSSTYTFYAAPAPAVASGSNEGAIPMPIDIEPGALQVRSLGTSSSHYVISGLSTPGTVRLFGISNSTADVELGVYLDFAYTQPVADCAPSASAAGGPSECVLTETHSPLFVRARARNGQGNTGFLLLAEESAQPEWRGSGGVQISGTISYPAYSSGYYRITLRTEGMGPWGATLLSLPGAVSQTFSFTVEAGLGAGELLAYNNFDGDSNLNNVTEPFATRAYNIGTADLLGTDLALSVGGNEMPLNFPVSGSVGTSGVQRYRAAVVSGTRYVVSLLNMTSDIDLTVRNGSVSVAAQPCLIFPDTTAETSTTFRSGTAPEDCLVTASAATMHLEMRAAGTPGSFTVMVVPDATVPTGSEGSKSAPVQLRRYEPRFSHNGAGASQSYYVITGVTGTFVTVSLSGISTYGTTVSPAVGDPVVSVFSTGAYGSSVPIPCDNSSAPAWLPSSCLLAYPPATLYILVSNSNTLSSDTASKRYVLVVN